MDYGDCIKQVTCLLFLKMADEREATVPNGCVWAGLEDPSGTVIADPYADVLRKPRRA